MDRQTLGVAVGGASVVGVAFGMARYAYGLTLPDVRAEFGLSEPLLGLIASGTFVGYLLGLLGAPRLSAARGPRAPTTLGGLCGVLGATTVALAPSPGVLAAGAVLAGSAAGWVWAPYSDIATALVPPQQRPTVLAVITTGTSLGLIVVAALGLVVTSVSWRLTWVGIAVAAALAAAVNLRAVPRLPARYRDPDGAPASLRRRSMAAPLVYATLHFASVTAYFTYASEVARSGGLAATTGPLIYAVAGLGGLCAVATGRMARVVGAPTVGIVSVCVVSASLGLLALARASLALTLGSAVLLGAGFMVGSSVLAIWTARAASDRPGDGFTVVLVVGAGVSIATPALMGALIPLLGLPTVLVVVACGAAVGALGLAALRAVRSLGVRAR